MSKNKKFQMPGNIRNKLMGAVAMLLVSSILMVSTTYAWFTLSTAPEVTGITTSVGANGNLEIALLNDTTYSALDQIKSNVGDSKDATGKSVTEANITWGNLVDLSDASYGSNKFVLNPARLNVTGSEGNYGVSNAAILKTAEYGSDGRVTELKENTVFATYNEDKFEATTDVGYGVRAIGVANAMSDQALAMRNAKASVALNVSTAKSTLQNSLNANGSALATLAMKFATLEDDGTYAVQDSDVTALNALIDGLNTAKGKLGDAIKNAKMAVALSENADASTTLTEYDLTAYSGESPAPVKTEINTAIEAYNALTIPGTLVAAGVTADQVKDAMEHLIGTGATIGGVELSEAKDNIGTLLTSLSSGLTLVPGDDSPYTKAAAFTGTITANAHIEDVAYGTIPPFNLDATMEASNTNVMSGVATGIKTLTVMEAGGAEAASQKITDMYGYAIDLAFRTNAASSNLLLQVDAAQRIYSDAVDESTQGGGSYMQFAPNGLTNKQFKSLLGAVRVVFVDAAHKILAVATPNTTTIADNTAAAVEAKLPLQLVNYSVENGVLEVTEATDATVITSLTQNTATKVTAIVYLDGDIVDNSMVAATAAQSMTGSMNLQFASSATLVPMDYTPLKQASTPAP